MSDGLRNELKITVSNEGALSGAGGAGPSDSIPWQVSRRAQIETSPFQTVSNYAADRQVRFSREMAMEISRDRAAVREIEEAVLRKQAIERLEVTSAQRAEQQARRNRLLTMVTARGVEIEDGELERKLLGRSRSVAKSGLRQLARGAIAGALTSAIVPEGGGIVGSLARIGGDAFSGAVFGGAPGAAFSAIWAGINELRNNWGQLDREIQMMRQRQFEIRLEVRAEIQAIRDGFERIDREFKEAFDKFVTDAVEDASINSYRQTRDITYDLVP